MTKLYIVRTDYKDVPSLIEIEARETNKYYIVEPISAFRYASRITKDDRRIHLTAEDALKAYVDNWKLQCERLDIALSNARTSYLQALDFASKTYYALQQAKEGEG